MSWRGARAGTVLGSPMYLPYLATSQAVCFALVPRGTPSISATSMPPQERSQLGADLPVAACQQRDVRKLIHARQASPALRMQPLTQRPWPPASFRRAPLLQLLEHIYKVPGLLGCLRGAVQSDAVANVEPVCWFLLTLASQVGTRLSARTAGARGNGPSCHAERTPHFAW